MRDAARPMTGKSTRSRARTLLMAIAAFYARPRVGKRVESTGFFSPKEQGEHMARLASGALLAAAVLFASLVRAQAPSPAQAGAPATREVDPGVFNTSPILNRAELRAGRVEIKPGGTRRVHQHDDVQFHLFIPLTGSVRLNVGAETIDASAGQVYFMDKGTPHGFTNASGSTATAVEVFVKPR